MSRLYFVLFFLVEVVLLPELSRAAEAVHFPKFRTVDPGIVAAPENLPSRLTLLLDGGFAPFSFKSVTGETQGIAVDLGLGACALLKIACTVKVVDYSELLPSLQNKQGDLILGGPAASIIQQARLTATKPYYYTFGRFLARNGSAVAQVEPKALAGLRVGFVAATRHAKFLEAHYSSASLMPFLTQDSLIEALRVGQLDFAFSDATQASFLLKGTAARGCCYAVGRPIIDFNGLAQGLSMVLRPEDITLRDAFDFALDRLQESGDSAKIFAKYLPIAP